MQNLAEKFYAGLYSDIVAHFIDVALPPTIAPADSVYIVGALSFLARTSEADAVYDAYSAQMSARESLEARFYLVLAHRRLRRKKSSEAARKIILSMVRDLRSKRDHSDIEKFFFCCAMAFYRYTDARLPLALGWARKAYDSAFRSQFTFGRLVSYDLMGHCQLNIGDIHAGLKNLANSAAIGDSLGRGATKQATDVGLRLYRSTFGLSHAQILLDELRGAIRACSFENSFSMANLLLEQSRLQVLAGRGDLAESSLKEAGEWVYRLDLPFFDANLGFRYAHLSYLQGDYKKSLDLLHSVRRRVSEANDAHMEIRILGLESLILKAQGKLADSNGLLPTIRMLAKKSGHIISRRINARLKISDISRLKQGEDLLGDLLDDIAEDGAASRERLVQSGFIGLIPKVVGCSLFSQGILFGFFKDSVTIIAKGHVRHDPDGWPDLVKKLCFAFSAKRELTKEEITEQVWHQKYNPTRHDPLIYALIARARKILEPQDSWLAVIDGKYQIDPALMIRDVSLASKPDGIAQRIQADAMSKFSDLHMRQIQILDLCEKLGALSNKDICENFNVSEVTASRDLAELVEKNYLRRVGKGRATSYTRS